MLNLVEETKFGNNNEVDKEICIENNQKNQKCKIQRWKVLVVITSVIAGLALLGFNIAVITSALSRNGKDIPVNIFQSLIVCDGKNLWALNTEGENPTILHSSNHSITAFDVYINETIFYNEINSSALNSTSKLYRNFVYTKIWQTQAIALDYVTKLLYVIDKWAGTLNVHDFRTKIHGVVLSDLPRPHDLLLDSTHGFMFILLQYDSILKCNMDGSLGKKIILDINISAFTINRRERRVYWPKDFESIESIDYVGQSRTTITQISTNVLSLAVLQDRLFWSSTSNCTHESISELWSCELIENTCSNITKHRISLKNPNVIKTSSFYLPVKNPCGNNGGCEHLCLQESHGKRKCACNVGWELNSDSRTCKIVLTFLSYVQGNYIRGKNPGNMTETFADVMFPRSFYSEPLKHKNSIDFFILADKILISDDNNIYRLSWMSNTFDGDQKKIFSIGKGYVIRNIEYDVVSNYLFYVTEDSVNIRSIAMLGLKNGEIVQKTTLRSYEGVFLVSLWNRLISPPNWNDLFRIHSPDILEKTALDKTNADNGNFKTFSRLLYFKMYELVAVDTVDSRLYWISNTSTTRIEYVGMDFSDKLELNVSNWKFMDLPIMMNPTSIVVIGDWMFIDNSSGIWRFDKEDGQDATEVTKNFEGDQRQLISHVKMNNFNTDLPVIDEDENAANYFQTHIGV